MLYLTCILHYFGISCIPIPVENFKGFLDFYQEPIEDCKGDDYFEMETQGKLHVLFSGTKVVNHTPVPKTSPGLKGITSV